jgi:hypothetical protein
VSLPFYLICFFFFTAFSILSLFFVLLVLMIICHGEVQFLLFLFVVLEASCTWICKTFSRFGKFSVIILLNILHFPLLAPLLLKCQLFSCLLFWWNCWVLAYSFHSSWDVWLRVLLFFYLFSILSLSSEILSSTRSRLLEWHSTVYFVWLKGLFISRIFVWFFAEVFQIFVLVLFYILYFV